MQALRLDPWLKGATLALLLASLSLLFRDDDSQNANELSQPSGAAKSGAAVEGAYGLQAGDAPCPPGTLPDAGACIPVPQADGPK